MSEPKRLRDGSGAAGRLLRTAELDVPSAAARARALAVADANPSLGAKENRGSGGAAFEGKSWALWSRVVVLAGSAVVIGVSQSRTHSPSPVASPVARPSSVIPGPLTTRSSSAPSLAALHEGREQSTVVSAAAPAKAGIAKAGGSRARASAPVPSGANEPRALAIPTSPIGAGAPPITGSEGMRPSLFDELRVIELARSAFTAGELTRAITALDDYERRYPRGTFFPEALALRVQSLARQGDLARARALASEFERSYPQHPLLARVQAAVAR